MEAMTLELPIHNFKGEQLVGLLNAEAVATPEWPPPKMRALVLVVNQEGTDQDLAIVVQDEAQFARLLYRYDGSYTEWFHVPVGRVLTQYPLCDVQVISPLTRVKVPYK